MKFRTDFVTNSSSSSFITVSIVNEDIPVSERFRFDGTSESFGRYNEIEKVGGATSGTELLNNLENYFHVTLGLTKVSEKVVNVDTIKNGVVIIYQENKYDDGERFYYKISYFIKDGVPIACKESDAADMFRLAKFGQFLSTRGMANPLVFDVGFDKVKNPAKINKMIESGKLAPGKELELWFYNNLYTSSHTHVGDLKNYTAYCDEHPYLFMFGLGKAEIVSVTPLSKRRKGSKYPAMQVLIKPKMTPMEYLKEKTSSEKQ